MVLELGEILKEINIETALEENREAVFTVPSNEAVEVMEKTEMQYFGEIELNSIGFNKVETQQYCIVGSLYIPKLLDVLKTRFRIQFFINEKYIIIVDDDGFAEDLIRRIMTGKSHQGETKAIFLFKFFSEFMSRDLEVLGQYEKILMRLEENVIEEKNYDYQSELIPIRKRMLTLRGYYNEVADMGKVLEDNENDLFTKEELKYFGIISDRAERLMGKSMHLLEYAGQIKDAYQVQADSRQSANMQFLTVISTIFFPLTLITGWYGMNFRDMPELENGYPGVIVLSLMVVLVCIIAFKKKKIF